MRVVRACAVLSVALLLGAGVAAGKTKCRCALAGCRASESGTEGCVCVCARGGCGCLEPYGDNAVSALVDLRALGLGRTTAGEALSRLARATGLEFTLPAVTPGPREKPVAQWEVVLRAPVPADARGRIPLVFLLFDLEDQLGHPIAVRGAIAHRVPPAEAFEFCARGLKAERLAPLLFWVTGTRMLLPEGAKPFDWEGHALTPEQLLEAVRVYYELP